MAMMVYNNNNNSNKIEMGKTKSGFHILETNERIK